MSLQMYCPQAPLSNYVQMLWYWEGYHPPHPKERILPAGMMEITINLADEPFQIYTPQDSRHPQKIVGPRAAGARSEYFMVDTTRPASILAVWFKAGGAIPFFGVSAPQLHNVQVPLETLWGRSAHDLYCQLLDTPTTGQRFRILEQALLHRLRRATPRHRAIDYALTLFREQPHAHKITEVVEKIALSPTRFIQLFREDVGMTPKLFCRIGRFQQALRVITSRPVQSWSEVALSCGYYDQAHFINEFQAFAGITPTAYAPQSPQHNSNLAVFEDSSG